MAHKASKKSYPNLYAQREMYRVNPDGTIKTREQSLKERANDFTMNELMSTLSTLNALNAAVTRRRFS